MVDPKDDKLNEKTAKAALRKAGGGAACDPDWTAGLKQLYDSVVDEPLPDAFKDLLSKLDETGTK